MDSLRKEEMRHFYLAGNTTFELSLDICKYLLEGRHPPKEDGVRSVSGISHNGLLIA